MICLSKICTDNEGNFKTPLSLHMVDQVVLNVVGWVYYTHIYDFY